MSRFEELYARLPAPLQSAALTAYGANLRRLRTSGAYNRYCERLEALQWCSADEIAAVQEQRLLETIREVSTDVPYYRRLFAELGCGPEDFTSAADLAQLPVMGKETVRQNLDDLRSDALAGRKVEQYSSGGTTGTSVQFRVDPLALQLEYAIQHTYQWGWAGVRYGERWMMINGRRVVPLDRQEPPFWRYNAAANEHFFSCFHIRDETIPIYLERLVELEPVICQFYPSTVDLFARWMIENDYTLDYSPRAIICTAETLYPDIRERVEATFGTRVFNHYTGDYALQICQCDHGSLHIAPLYGFVEYEPVEDPDIPGLSEMILTTLSNRGTTLLRYRIGDTVVPGTSPCPCGRGLPHVDMIWGRTVETVTTPEGNTINASNLTDVFKHTPNIRRCQFIQREPGALLARMEVTADYGDADESGFLDELRSRIGDTMPVTIEIVDEIPLTTSGKFRFVINELV